MAETQAGSLGGPANVSSWGRQNKRAAFTGRAMSGNFRPVQSLMKIINMVYDKYGKRN
jgi:hypothetical protein